MQFQTVRRSRDPPRCESRALPRVADDGEMIGRGRREYRRLTMRPKASKAPPWSARRKSEREAASHFISISSARSRCRAAPTVPASVAGCSREAPALHVNTPRASSARVDSAQGPQLCVAPCSFHRATDSAAGSRSRVARTRSAGACGAAPARLREVAWGIAVSEAAAPLDMGFIHDRREWAPSPPVRRCRQSPDRRRPR